MSACFTTMSDHESIQKMLRAVLQSSKEGVSLSSLQSDYQALCGENIPLKKLGYSRMEDYLRSIPSVVQLEYRMGQLRCFAAVCQETAHIAELVAKQKNAKKSGHSQVINCRMRFRPSKPYMLNARPRSSLRQPAASNISNWTDNRPRSHGSQRGFGASGDYRKERGVANFNKSRIVWDHLGVNHFNSSKPLETKPPKVSSPNQYECGLYNVELVQSRMCKLLEKYCSGLWMSKLSEVYSTMFTEKLHPQALIDLEKWAHICMVEKPSSSCRADSLIYPPLPPRDSSVTATPANIKTINTPISSRPSTPEQASASFPPSAVCRVSSKSPDPASLGSLCNTAGAPYLLPSVNLTGSSSNGLNHNNNVPSTVRKQNTKSLTCNVAASASIPSQPSSPQTGPDIFPLKSMTPSPTSDSAHCPPSKPSAAVVSAEVRQRIKEVLCKCSHGVWASALPKLYLDTYKMPFPEHILTDLSLLLDMCMVEYPVSHDKTKAILYYSSRADIGGTIHQEDRQCRGRRLSSGLEVRGPVLPPSLVPPPEQYPSVLITDVKSSNAVTIRYVGENYSNAQEAMEDTMRSFYQSFTHRPPCKPVVGQLVAVRGEDGDELARAQVMEVIAHDRVKVYYVDYGFSVETSGSSLLELCQDFLSLPFQATNVRLAGLESLSSHPVVLSSLDKLAVGRILLMESIEPCQQDEVPLVVLYDTSQDVDININSMCLKALWDKTLNCPLTVKTIYKNVRVTNVGSEGTIYCQLPSRGTARLMELLEEQEAILNSQMTSESLVSRPFSGKTCLARYKGRWSRVEITTLYGNRVMEILFFDLAVTATVEVTDLREFPPALLQDLTIIPPQATRCRLADLKVPEGDWSPAAVLWMKEALLASEDCKMRILNIEQQKEDCLVHMYLFLGTESLELEKSINHQLAQSELWNKTIMQNNNMIASMSERTDPGAAVETLLAGSSVQNPPLSISTQPHAADASSCVNFTDKAETRPLSMPPPLELPQPGQNVDVFVPAVCHPGHFVLQQWQDLHKLMVLMGEMILYYNQTWKGSTTMHIQKGEIYAAKIDKNWYRVQVKGILTSGRVSIYELDYGKHELVHSNLLHPLIEEFRQLPFQAITAQLAGVTQHQWSEAASMLFRNHVEDQALVAQVESVQDLSVKGEPWERRVTVYLVDTSLADRDLWIHSIMADIDGELSSAA